MSIPRQFHPSRKARIAAIAALCLLAAMIYATKFTIKGQFEGLFLLKGRGGRMLELKDDLYLGDGHRLLFAVDLGRLHLCRRDDHKQGRACIYYEWDAKEGNGFVRNYMPGGEKVLTCFGRFVDDGGREVHGLFVGGGLPANVGDDEVTNNETGMAYYDNRKWYHLWCTANEGLGSGATLRQVPPSAWRFLGSRVLNASDTELALKSSHEAVVDGVPIRVDRMAYFRAGQAYFILSIKVTNKGARDANVVYCYGDEPWVGHYGSSRGNVGWVKEGLVETVQWVDPETHMYAGYFDYGNTAAGEGHNFTGKADFVQWLGAETPAVYFSNSPAEYPTAKNRAEPLAGNSRFIGLQWGPRVLRPREAVFYRLAIGMAGSDPKTGFPAVPKLDIDPAALNDARR